MKLKVKDLGLVSLDLAKLGLLEVISKMLVNIILANISMLACVSCARKNTFTELLAWMQTTKTVLFGHTGFKSFLVCI